MFIKKQLINEDLNLNHRMRAAWAPLLAASSLFILAGCGGGGSSSSGGSPPPAKLAAGSYQGVYLNSSGASSPDAGILKFTISSAGAVSGSTVDYTGDGSTKNITGTVSSSGVFNGSLITGTVVTEANDVVSIPYTETNGTKGILKVGVAPTALEHPGTYTGTVTSASGTFPETLIISTDGTVSGSVGDPTVVNKGFNLVGYVDKSGNIYLAYRSGGTPEYSVVTTQLNGAVLTGASTGASSDGGIITTTISLTKM